MLLNPSHKITCSGLSPDLLDAYVRYKKGTRAIIAWLLEHGTKKYRSFKKLAIADMLALAEIVSRRRPLMPDSVDFHFRETIAAREYLSNSFRKLGQGSTDDTVNHEYFTSSLSLIYSNLCQFCGRIKPEYQKPSTGEDLKSDDLLQNRFGALSVHATVVDDEDEDYAIADSPGSSTEGLEPCTENLEALELFDDDLGDAIELVTVLQEMWEVKSTIVECWKRRDTPIVVTACITNVGMIMLRELACRICNIDSNTDLDFEEMHRKCHLVRNLGQRRIDSDGIEYPAWHTMLQDLNTTWRALKLHANSDSVIGRPRISRPVEHVPEPTSNGTRAERHSLNKLMLNLGQHFKYESTIEPDGWRTIAMQTTTLFLKRAELFAQPGERRDMLGVLRGALGLHILLRSYQAFLYEPAPSNSSKSDTTNPRIQCLRLAATSHASLSALLAAHPPKSNSTFPCRCHETLACHLEELKDDLEVFKGEKTWDLLYQSPCVAGNHMLEILRRTDYYGVKLMRYRNLVAAVVHVYNALRNTAGMGKVTVLERACNELTALFWSNGKRADQSFRPAYWRWLGTRLKFKKGRRGHKHERHSWCMYVPSHRAKESAGLGAGVRSGNLVGSSSEGVVRREKISILNEIVKRDFQVSKEMWNEVWQAAPEARNPETEIKTSPKQKTTKTSALSASSAVQLRTLQTTLSTEYRRHNEPAKLDLFSFYSDCVRVVERVSDAGHEDAANKGSRCLCFVEKILGAADRVLNGRRLSGGVEVFEKVKPEAIEIVRAALEGVFGFEKEIEKEVPNSGVQGA